MMRTCVFRLVRPVAGLALAFGLMAWAAADVRIKDIATFIGARDNQLLGYGLVMGLEGTGDKDRTIFTMQSMSNMLRQFGLNLDPTKIKVKNVAAVMVGATLPPFAKPGDRVDVTVSSIGDATNLQGGYLMLTPLKGADNEVYLLAQGPVSIGGFNFSAGGGEGGGAATTQKNHTTVGRVPGGGIVEKGVPTEVADNGRLCFSLTNPDYTTAARMATAINEKYLGCATALDAGRVEVRVPDAYRDDTRITPFIESIESVRVAPDVKARIVINERTGTIVAGGNVRISTVAVSHGNLHLTIKTQPSVSQPNAFGAGQTVVTTQTGMDVTEESARLVVLEEGVSIQDVSNTLNSLGVTPRDMISIFQTMKEAGALQADLVVI